MRRSHRPLTDRQAEILAYIVRFRARFGFAPSIREIGEEFGIASTNGVNDHLVALERKGHLTRERFLSRAIVPAGADGHAFDADAIERACATWMADIMDTSAGVESMPGPARLRWQMARALNAALQQQATPRRDHVLRSFTPTATES